MSGEQPPGNENEPNPVLVEAVNNLVQAEADNAEAARVFDRNRLPIAAARERIGYLVEDTTRRHLGNPLARQAIAEVGGQIHSILNQANDRVYDDFRQANEARRQAVRDFGRVLHEAWAEAGWDAGDPPNANND